MPIVKFNPDEPYDDVLGSPTMKFHQEGRYYNALGKYVCKDESNIEGARKGIHRTNAELERLALVKKHQRSNVMSVLDKSKQFTAAPDPRVEDRIAKAAEEMSLG